MSIRVGQIYASQRLDDIVGGVRQRRRVVEVSGSFVWLKTEDGFVNSPPSRIRLRSPLACTIPSHRLVEDVLDGGGEAA